MLGWAYVKDQAPNVTLYDTESGTIIMGCSIFGVGCVDVFDPRAWFVTGSVLIVAAAVPFALAARRR